MRPRACRRRARAAIAAIAAASAAQGNELGAERDCERKRIGCEHLHFPNLRAYSGGADDTRVARELARAAESAASSWSSGGAARLLGELPHSTAREDVLARARVFTPMPAHSANAIAALVSFSVVAAEATLREAFTHEGVAPRPPAGNGGGGADDDAERPHGPLGSADRAGAELDLLRLRDGAVSELTWVGCHIDHDEVPLLPHYRGAGLTTSVCARLCVGFPYFAMQGPGAQCRCGARVVHEPTTGLERHARHSPYRKVNDHECGRPCPNEGSLQPTRYCGMRGRNAIYRLPLPRAPVPSGDGGDVSQGGTAGARDAGATDGAPTVLSPLLAVAPPAVASVQFVGCYSVDKRGRPPLPYHFGAGHSSTSCARACESFIYFALTRSRDWGECLCGDELHAGRQSAPSKCGDICDGEEGAAPPRYCGTKRETAVYKGLGCHDAVSWSNAHGYTCREYALHKWCDNGTLRDVSTGGEVNHFPEHNCCACGRAAAEATAPTALRGASGAPALRGAPAGTAEHRVRGVLAAAAVAALVVAAALLALGGSALRRRRAADAGSAVSSGAPGLASRHSRRPGAAAAAGGVSDRVEQVVRML